MNHKLNQLIVAVALSAAVVVACNKAPEAPVALPTTGTTIVTANNVFQVLDTAKNDSLFARLVKRVGAVNGITSILATGTNGFTIFVPDNTVMKNFIAAATGGLIPAAAPDATHSAFLSGALGANSLPIASAVGLVNYHIITGTVRSTAIPTTFPNAPQPTYLAVSTATPFVRLANYPSRRGTDVWLNNIPVIPAIDVTAVNGVIHHIAAVAVPPSSFLWDRINVDADLTYLRAAVLRADSGVVSVPGTLNTNSVQSLLSNFGPNFTLFAPLDAAFRATLYAVAYPNVYNQIYQAVYTAQIAGGATVPVATAAATAAATANAPTQTNALVATPAVFSNPALFGALPASTVKGILVSHVLGSRAFSVNLPTAVTNVPTLLNGAIPAHPGVKVAATFAGPFVTGITVQGVGNVTSFPVVMNPNPNGSSDQNCVNGVMHKIAGVLLPQ